MKDSSIKRRFIVAIFGVFLYSAICTLIERPWYAALAFKFTPIIAHLIIITLAFLPGIMIMMCIIGVILDKQPRYPIITEDLEDVTILIAAYNEEASIYGTLQSLAEQKYHKNVIIKVINNNSKDNTKQEIERAIADFPKVHIEYMEETKQGKFAALNHGLLTTNTKYVITLDADTFLEHDALLLLVNRMTQEQKRKNVVAIAGAVWVKNANVNILTKMQAWEYYLSIASIKRSQGLFKSTLVAQGAFSIYDTAKVKYVGGWCDSIGEDIVLTWNLMQTGGASLYEDRAIAYTNAPIDFTIFARQRARWSRGLIEGLRYFSFSRCQNYFTRFFVFTDYFLFGLDTGVSLFYTPGLIAAIFFHVFDIVGPSTLLLFPLTVFEFLIMLASQYYRVSKPLKVKLNYGLDGLLAYMVCFSMILSPICIKGYAQEIFKIKRQWR